MVKNESILFKWSNAHNAGIRADTKRNLLETGGYVCIGYEARFG